MMVNERNGRVLPIEIKSGKDYKRHNALKNVLETTNYAIQEAAVFCNDNVYVKGKVMYCPIYMLMFLKNEEIDLGTYKVDLRGLVERANREASRSKKGRCAEEARSSTGEGREEGLATKGF